MSPTWPESKFLKSLEGQKCSKGHRILMTDIEEFPARMHRSECVFHCSSNWLIC